MDVVILCSFLWLINLSKKKNPTADGLMKEMHAIEEFIAKLEYREKQSNQTLSKIPGIEKWESKNVNQIR